MTETTPTTEPRTLTQGQLKAAPASPIAAAISALSTAANETRLRGVGTPHEHSEPVDFAEIACHVLTTVAANRGGIEQLLAGRPGSWEGDLIRRIVEATAGDQDPWLLSWRTDPIHVDIDPEAIFDDAGLQSSFDSDVDALNREAEQAYDALVDATASESERESLEALNSAVQALDDPFDRAGFPLREARGAILTQVFARAEATRHPLWRATALSEHALEHVWDLWERDQADYLAAFTGQLEQALVELGGNPDLKVIVHTPNDSEAPYSPFELDEVADAVYSTALKRTPLPTTDSSEPGYAARARTAADATLQASASNVAAEPVQDVDHAPRDR